MSEHRVLVIENPVSLSVDLGRIRIRRHEQPDIFVLPEDIAVLVLHHHTIQLSSQVLQLLTEHRAIVLVTDSSHLPSGCLSPAYGLPKASSRLQQQIKLPQKTANRLWQSIVQARISTEATNLRKLKLKGAIRLERMSKEVEPGDARHHEGQAARHYWRHLFDQNHDFKRSKRGAEDVLNASLNYGYAVLRALVARELAIASLVPMLGLGHRNTENPFNLADDFMEPYRFMVEHHVREKITTTEEFNTQTRMSILSFIKGTVSLHEREFRLPAAIRETVGSYCRVLDTGKGPLALPS